MEKKIRCLDDAIDVTNFYTHKGVCCFRGQTQNWPVVPSNMRNDDRDIDFSVRQNELIHTESKLFAEFFLNGGYKNFPYMNSNDPFTLLCNLQHFGQATRLLDVSMDPLVALYFACSDKEKSSVDKDGVLYVFKVGERSGLGNDLSGADSKEIDVFAFGECVNKTIRVESPMFREPPSKNIRMRAQDGAFYVWPHLPLDTDRNSFATFQGYVERVNQERKDSELRAGYFLMKVEACCKDVILEELEYHYGISEESLFLGTKLNGGAKEAKKFYEDFIKRAGG